MEDDRDEQRATEAPEPDFHHLDPPSAEASKPSAEDEPAPSSRLSLGPLGALGFGPPPSGEELISAARVSGSTLTTVASLVIVIAALKVAAPVLVPLTVSAFLAALIAPFVFYLKKRGVPPQLGVPVVMLVTLAVVAAVAGLVVGSVNTLVQELPTYQVRLYRILSGVAGHLEQWGFPITTSNLYSFIQPTAIVQFVGNALSQVADVLSNIFLVLLMTIFVLFEAIILPRKIRLALSDPHADLSRGLRVVGRIKAYVIVKTSTSLATGVAIGLALHLMGVDFALLWGLVAFLFNFIPNIGSIVAAVPAVLMALLQLGFGGAIGTSVVFLVTNLVIGSMLEPQIMGKRLNLSPLIVFVSLILWGWLWGPIGMLLSVPLTMATRILLDGNESTRPFAILMAGAPEEELDDVEEEKTTDESIY